MSCARVIFCLPPKKLSHNKPPKSPGPGSRKNSSPDVDTSSDDVYRDDLHVIPGGRGSIYFDARQSMVDDEKKIPSTSEGNGHEDVPATHRRKSFRHQLRQSLSRKSGQLGRISMTRKCNVGDEEKIPSTSGGNGNEDVPATYRQKSFRHQLRQSLSRKSGQLGRISMTRKRNAVLKEEDDRPFISDLLQEHSSSIEAVCDQIKDNPFYDESRYDDIWILRFVLSHKNSDKAASEAALKTMKFRHEMKLNELGDIRHKIPRCGEGESYFSCHNKYSQFCKADDALTHSLPDNDRSVITYIMLCNVDMSMIAKEMSEKDLQDVYLYFNEAAYQIHNEVTRRTGRLTKLLRVIDLNNMKLREVDHNYLKGDAAASKLVEDYYPQLLGSILFVNSPSWVNVSWKLMRPLFPHRVVEKVNFVSPKKRAEDVKPFLKYTSIDDLPERYGGRNKQWPLVCAGDLFLNGPK